MTNDTNVLDPETEEVSESRAAQFLEISREALRLRRERDAAPPHRVVKKGSVQRIFYDKKSLIKYAFQKGTGAFYGNGAESGEVFECEAAKILDINSGTIRRMRKDGDIEPARVRKSGSRVYRFYDREYIESVAERIEFDGKKYIVQPEKS